MINSALVSLIAFQAAKPVEVPFHLGDNAIVVDSVVNGKKVSCMFDTGFSGAYVMGDNINVGKPSGTMTLRDFVGQFQASTVPIKTLTIGDAKITTQDLTVVQQPMDHMSMSYNTHTDGIMGLEVMKEFVLEINFEKKKFVLHPKTSDPIGTKKADGKKTFLIKMLPMGHNSIELPVTTPAGETMVLALDTGNAFYGTTHRDVLERVGLWKAGEKPNFMRTAWVASGPVPSFYMYFDELNIYGVPVKGSTWSIIDLPSSSSDHDGTIGFGFLKNFNVTIDMGRRRVFLDNYSGKTADPVKADVGISPFFDSDSKRYIIASVTPGGPAEKAGIRRGDHLLGVNGDDVGGMGQRALIEKLEGDLDSVANLAISRAGNFMKVEVKRAYLVNGKK